VQDSPNGHLDLWARDHYKSSILTFGLTIQDILRTHGDGAEGDKELCIGIFSHTRPIAKAFLRQIKREFEGNKVLLELFPDILWDNPQGESPKWSEDDGIILRRRSNPKEATVEAWGLVDGQPVSKHFDILVYDDVVTLASVNTPDMINKTTDALRLSFNLGTDAGVKRFIGTRYHFNDTYGALMKTGTVSLRVYPATHDGTVEGEPVLLTREKLDEKRREQGPYIYACQMLQNPKADETQGFMRDWLRYYDNIERSGLNVYILVDPAGEKRKTNDFTSAWAVGLGTDNNIIVLDMVRDRMNLKERARLLMDWHRKYSTGGGRIQQVRYEKYGMQSDIEHIRTVQETENYRFEITPVAGQTAKNDRIRRLVPYFEQGRIYLPRYLNYTNYQGETRDLVQDFIEEEYMPFPVPNHDDMLDALARIAEPDIPLVWPKIKIVGTEEAPQSRNWMDM
jgi:predicted phage terminase large subunit-like protein